MFSEQPSDPYAVLGVAPETSAVEIRRVYRRLARQYHPDRNPGDPSAGERFKQLGAAMALLGDPQRRHAYDQALAATAQRTVAAVGSQLPDRGYDVTYPVRLSADEAQAGAVRQLSFHGADGARQQIPVGIPAGSRQGDRVRVVGRGGPGRAGGPRGDLIAVVQIVEARSAEVAPESSAAPVARLLPGAIGLALVLGLALACIGLAALLGLIL